MGSISYSAWQNAYMLEFVSSSGTYDVFTFSVPPESEELVFPQRIYETKTFGGSVFDLYGNDTIPITIQGSTVNEDEKVIYRGLTKAPLMMTGTQEIFHLQEVIHSWSGNPYLKDKKIYLYSLSRMSVAEISISGRGNPVNCLPVHIKNLKIVRNKSNPRAYKYTLDLIAYREELLAQSPAAGISAKMEKILKVSDVLTRTVKTVKTTRETISRLNTLMVKVGDTYNRIKERGIASSNINIVLSAASGADTITRLLTGDSGAFYSAAVTAFETMKTVDYLVRTEETAGEGKKAAETRGLLTVSFETNGGGYISPRKIDYRGSMTVLPVPVRDRFSFKGWYIDRELTVPYSLSTEIMEDMMLYAGWSMLSALVRFSPNGGSNVPSQTVPVGGIASEPGQPERTGYLFEGWFSDAGLTVPFDFTRVIRQDTTLYAKWILARTVSFAANGGSSVETQHVADGDTAVYPPVPVKDDHIFVRWCSDAGLTAEYSFLRPVSSDITLYADWKRITHSVIFDASGGSSVETQHVPLDGMATEPESPVRSGFEFDQWYTDVGLTVPFDFSEPVTEDITLYAGWSVLTFTVTFDSNGGSSVDAQTVSYGGRVLYPGTPTLAGHTFLGWFSDEELTTPYDFSGAVSSGMTLYARWHED